MPLESHKFSLRFLFIIRRNVTFNETRIEFFFLQKSTFLFLKLSIVCLSTLFSLFAVFFSLFVFLISFRCFSLQLILEMCSIDAWRKPNNNSWTEKKFDFVWCSCAWGLEQLTLRIVSKKKKQNVHSLHYNNNDH